ncbi:MAG: porin family protein [Myxococcales bacterium]|nr:porin family protein [Myxococcales bacterium]
MKFGIVAAFAAAGMFAEGAVADAVLVSGGTASAAAVSFGGSISASLSFSGGIEAAPAEVTVTPVLEEPATPRIRIRPSFGSAATVAAPPAPVVVQGAPVATPRIRVRSGVRAVAPATPPAPVVVQAAPAVVVAPAPRPAVVVAPAPPPAVVVAPAPAPVMVATTCGCCGCDGGTAVALEEEAPADDDVDLMLFGNYRYLEGGDQVGGASLALRLLLTDELSLEAGLGYLAGGTNDGRGREEVPTSLSLLWYVAGRDFPLYLGVGAVADWTQVWVDADGWDIDGNADLFRLGGRAAVGVEWSFLDLFLLTAELEAFVREAVDGATCDAGPGTPACTEVGVATNVGLGLRF